MCLKSLNNLPSHDAERDARHFVVLIAESWRETDAGLMTEIVTTTRLRLQAGPHNAELDRTGQFFGHLECLLHVHLRAIDRGTVAGGEPATRNDLKTMFCKRHGITARYFNSLIRALEGKHAGIVAKAKLDADDTETRLKAVRQKIDRSQKKLEAHGKAVTGIADRKAQGKAPTKAQ